MSPCPRIHSSAGETTDLVAIVTAKATCLFVRAVRFLLGIVCALAVSLPAKAGVQPFPSPFRAEEIKTEGATIHVRVGGRGPAVILLHGFGDTGDMWAPLAAPLVHDHTVVVPDLRGMGLSSHPEGGYDKKTQAGDIVRVLDKLGIQKADLVTHDIGNMVGYAFAAQYPDRVTRFVIMDAPLPGIGSWDEIVRSPALWHFNFRGPDVERLVKGRERIYLDRFWNELSANPRLIDEATRRHYAKLYARPGAMHSAFNQFAAFGQDAVDNKAFAGQGQVDDAGAGDRRRKILWTDHGQRDALCRHRCDRACQSRTRDTG
jgi:pimeloyl-ACP methyl ester carboxylesterase